MIIDAKVDYKSKKLILIKADGTFEEKELIPPYFYVIVNPKEEKILRRVVGTDETWVELDNKKAIVYKETGYEVDPLYTVYRIYTQSPSLVPQISEMLQSLGFRIAGSNVRYVIRNCFDHDIRFFNTIPLYYGFDSDIMNKIRNVEGLIIDVEAIEGEPILASVYRYRPFEEIQKDDVEAIELPKDIDRLRMYIHKYSLIMGHNIIGFDIPVLNRAGLMIDTITKSFFDSSVVLSTYGHSLKVGSARSLLDVSIVLKDEAGITDEEIEIKRKVRGRIDRLSKEDLVKYNTNDVVLTAKLLNIFFPFVASVSALTQIPLSEVMTLPSGMVAEYYLLRFIELLGYVPEYRPTKAVLQGERVWLASEGVEYRNVLQTDVKMMYPSFVLNHFIDPTLYTGNDKFDRRKGIGVVYSAVKRLKTIRDMTKRLKKQNKLYEPVDHGVKSILNALAYGVQGKKSGLAILGNPWCPTKIFYGTREAQFNTIKYMLNKGYKVVYSDSVTGDTPIVISIDNKILLIPIEMLFNELVRNGAKIIRSEKEYLIPNVKIYVASWKDGKVVWKPIKALIRHKVTKPIYKIRTKHGYMEVTQDHSIVSKDGRLIRPVDIIEKGIEPLAVRHIPLPSYTEHTGRIEINIIESPVGQGMKLDINRFKEDIIRYSVFTTRFNYDGETLDLRDYLVKFFEKHFDIYKVDDTYIYLRSRTKDTRIVRVRYRYSKKDGTLQSLAYILGYYIGDGSATICKQGSSGIKYNFRFSSSDVKRLERLKQILKMIFPDYEPTITGREEERILEGKYRYVDRTKHLQLGNKVAVLFFAILAGFGNYKHVPNFIYIVDDDIKLWFLAGLVGADGAVTIYQGSTYVNITTKNRLLATGICLLLALVGIDFFIDHAKDCFTVWLRRKERKGFKMKYSVETNEQFVYDVDVEDSDTFIGDVGLIVFHNTDSFYIALEGCRDDKECESTAEKIVNELNDFLKKYGLEVDVEGIWDRMYIYSKKNYILKKGDIVIVKGSALLNLDRFYTVEAVSIQELLKYDDKKEREKILKEMIDSAPLEDLFVRGHQQIWRLIGKDVQSWKRLGQRRERYMRVLTPWNEKPTLVLKKARGAQLLLPHSSPILTLFIEHGSEVDLSTLNPFNIVELRSLRVEGEVGRLKGRYRLGDIIVYTDSIYTIKVEGIKYGVRMGQNIKLFDMWYEGTFPDRPIGVLEFIKGALQMWKVKIDEDLFRKLVFLDMKKVLKQYGFL